MYEPIVTREVAVLGVLYYHCASLATSQQESASQAFRAWTFVRLVFYFIPRWTPPLDLCTGGPPCHSGGTVQSKVRQD